jgi:glycosyltransferase involved in cell wall biosynthesis
MSLARKTRVLYVNHTGLVSGAEKMLINILRGIDRSRYEPYVVCPARGELAAAVHAEGAEWFPLPAINARFSLRPDRLLQSVSPVLRSVAAMRAQIRTLDPDIIHANSVRAGIAASMAAVGTGKPVIWHVHDTLPRHPVSSAIRTFAFADRSARAIAVSQSTANSFRGQLPFGSRVRTIYNGTDLSRFPQKRPGKSAFRERIGVSSEEFLVCAVGQICARKGLLELIDALRRIRNEAPDVHVAIVGKVVFPHESVYLDAMRAAIAEAGLEDRVHFTGELADVSSALQAADLLVLNSLDEPFGLVLIEAMSSGTPVVATRVGGVPEIVTDEENGWLIDKGDTAALALRMLKLSRDRGALAQVAQRALNVTCPKFSLERFQDELMRFYAELDPDTDRKWNVRDRPALARSGNH